ncbi:hypothetical protein JCM33374_g3823 [Metschnikowia sp. JCM 33374]|nr:hypothetical protein JCM33374_g3823 [Metschnikowia sp. JCM 33374]
MKFCTWMTTSFFAFRLAIASPMGRILPKSSCKTHGDEPDHLENCEYAQNGSVSRGLDDVELDDTYSLLLEVSRRISTIAEADSDQFFDASESIVWSDNGCWNPNEGTLLNDEDTLLNDEDTIMNDEETPLIDENPPLNDGALENTQNPEETQEMVPPKPDHQSLTSEILIIIQKLRNCLNTTKLWRFFFTLSSWKARMHSRNFIQSWLYPET